MEVNIYIKGKCYRAYGGKYIHKGKMLQGIWR